MLRIEINTVAEAPALLTFKRSSWNENLRGFVYTVDSNELWFITAKDIKYITQLPKPLFLDYLIEKQMKENDD